MRVMWWWLHKGGSWWERDRVPCSLVAGHLQCLGRGWRERSRVVESSGGGIWVVLARLG